MQGSDIASLLFLVVYLGFIAVMIASTWKVFTKAGKPGWACLIPIYNTYVMIKISDNPWWFLLLLMVPIVSIYPAFKIPIDIAKEFGKGVGYGLGLALLPFIFFPMLAFGDATYQNGGDGSTVTV